MAHNFVTNDLKVMCR